MKIPKIEMPKFVKWLMFNPVDLVTSLIKAKQIKREMFLMKEYESGRILQVDNGKDNKKLLLKLESN